MGMHDNITLKKIWCPWCGAVMENNNDWQTKDGECLLASYPTPELFFEANPDVFYANVINICPSCKHSIELNLRNDSPELKEKWAKEAQEWRENIAAEQLSVHPNHPAGGYTGRRGRVASWNNAWCPICKETGYYGELHPDADPEFVKSERDKYRELYGRRNSLFASISESMSKQRKLNLERLHQWQKGIKPLDEDGEEMIWDDLKDICINCGSDNA